MLGGILMNHNVSFAVRHQSQRRQLREAVLQSLDVVDDLLLWLRLVLRRRKCRFLLWLLLVRKLLQLGPVKNGRYRLRCRFLLFTSPREPSSSRLVGEGGGGGSHWKWNHRSRRWRDCQDRHRRSVQRADDVYQLSRWS